MEPIFGKYAERYAAASFEVFPLAYRSKKPMHGTNGLSDATADMRTVWDWAKEFPYANIGVRTGPGSGADVIDIDPLHHGFDTERGLRKEGKFWPDTPVSRTRSGGRHVWVQHSDLLVTGTNRLGQGIDFRASGGYVVAPPSIVRDEKTEREGKYSWLAWPKTGIAPAPDWLLEQLEEEKREEERRAEARAKALPRAASSEPDFDRVRKALRYIPSDDRDVWVHTGMVLKAFGEAGRALWDAWSRGSEKFNPIDQEKIWRSFKGGSRSIGTIFHYRRALGSRRPLYRL